MVPGMTERERLAADVRRLEWLAEARFGPASITRSPTQADTPDLPPGHLAARPHGGAPAWATHPVAAGNRRTASQAGAVANPVDRRPPIVERVKEAFMEVPRSSTPSRLTAVASRRTSLFTLGGTLAGVVLHAPTIEARKNNKKNEAKKKCKKQVAGCREQLRAFCDGNAACEAEILPCCAPLADCQAGDTVACAYAYLEL